MIGCLAKISPLNVLTGARFDVYLSSVGDRIDGPLVNGLGGFTWEPATITAPSLAMQLWNGDFTASVAAGQAVLPINLAIAKKSYPGLDTAAWTGAPIEIYAEEPGTAWPWTRRFAGRITGWEGGYPRLNLTAEVDQQPFSANVLTATYAGTGGIEGGEDLKNQPKPLIFGWAQNVEPVLIDAVNSVYQFSGYGPIETVSTLYERGSNFGASVNDYGNYAALVSATIPAGRWATCLAQGLIRLGAPAYGVITGDVRGHVVGSTTPRLTGSVISALARLAGVSSGTGALDIITAPPVSVQTLPLSSDVATAPAGDLITAAPGSVGTAAPSDVITAPASSFGSDPYFPILTAPLSSIVTAPPAAFDTGTATPTIENGSLAALDLAVPYPINIVVTQQETFLELAQRLVLPCNWTAGISLVGRFFVASIGLSGPEVLTLDAQGRAVPQVLTSQEEAVSPPYTKTTMGAARSWRVHSADEISFQATLVERGRYDPATTYREGNIVDVEDGSRWVYIAITPTAGNAPPAWPTTSNTWWDSLSPPASGDTIVAELSAPNQSVTAASNGSVASFTGIGGVFTLRQNNVVIAAGVTFSIVSQTGMSVSINAATGAYTVNSMSANTGTAVFRATYSGFTFDKTYTLSKVLAGTPGGGAGTPATSMVTSKKSISIFAYADGNIPAGSFVDTNGQMTVFSGNTDVTATASLSATGAGCTGTINTAANTPVSGKPKGYYEVTAMSVSVDSATLTLQATYGGVTLTEIFSISKIKTGYEIVSALPTINLYDGRQVYLTSERKLYTYKGIPGSGGAWTKVIDGADIQAASISTAALAANIAAPVIVTDLPLTKTAEYVSYGGSLYRWNGIAYTKSVPAADLSGQVTDAQIAAVTAAKLTGQITETQVAPGAITTPKLAAGSVTTAILAADSVTASKLVLTAGGYINKDPGLDDFSVWGFEVTPFTFVTISDAPVGNKVMRSMTNATTQAHDEHYYAIDPTKRYRFRFWARRSATGNGLLYATLRQFTAPGVNGPVNGGRSPYKPDAVIASTTWTEYSAEFGPGDWQAGVKYVQLDWLLNYGGTAGYMEMCHPRFEELVSAELIVDGSITANEIAANAVRTVHLEADSVTSAKIAAGAVGATEVAAQEINAKHLAISDFNNLIPAGDFATGTLDGWSGLYSAGPGSSITVVTDPGGSGWPSKYGLLMFRGPSDIAADVGITAGAVDFNDPNAFASGVDMQPGDEIYFEATVWSNGGIPQVTPWCRPDPATLYLLDGVALTGCVSDNNTLYGNGPLNTFYKLSGWFKNNTGVREKVFLRLYHLNDGSHPNTTVYWFNVKSRRRNSGSLIVDGAVKANHVATNSLVADNIAFGTLTGAQMAVTEIIAYQAQIKDLTVDTLHVKDGAITTTSTAFSTGEVFCPLNTSTTIQSLFLAATGAPVHITYGFGVRSAFGAASTYGPLRLYRNGTLIYESFFFGGFGAYSMWTFPIVDVPPPGGTTYSLVVYPAPASVPGIGPADCEPAYCGQRSLNALQTKK